MKCVSGFRILCYSIFYEQTDFRHSHSISNSNSNFCVEADMNINIGISTSTSGIESNLSNRFLELWTASAK